MISSIYFIVLNNFFWFRLSLSLSLFSCLVLSFSLLIPSDSIHVFSSHRRRCCCGVSGGFSGGFSVQLRRPPILLKVRPSGICLLFFIFLADVSQDDVSESDMFHAAASVRTIGYVSLKTWKSYQNTKKNEKEKEASRQHGIFRALEEGEGGRGAELRRDRLVYLARNNRRIKYCLPRYELLLFG